MTAAEKLADLGYGLGWSVVSRIPQAPSRWVGDRVADRAARRPGKGARQYARNLYRVLSHGPAGPRTVPVTAAHLHETVRLGLRSYARYWRETFQLPALDADEVARQVAAGSVGLEHLRRAADSGRGAVLALPHSGNWDVAGLMMGRLFGGITSVAERLKPESLYDRFVAYRESLGMEILPLTGGAQSVSGALKERLTAGRIVCLLGDRDLTSSGVEVDFFGEKTRMPAGPAMLAALTGADLIAVHLTYDGSTGWHQEISAPLTLPGTRLAEQVRGGTQLLADHYAAGIARTPHDWHMLQPLWLDDLPPERRARIENGRTR